METWDVGAFDNDSARRLLADHAAQSGDLVHGLLVAIGGRAEGQRVSMGEASAAVAAAALVAEAWSGLSTGDALADDWLARYALPITDASRDLALDALDRVATSDLADHWADVDSLAEWNVTLGRIRQSLHEPRSDTTAAVGHPNPPIVAALRVGDVIDMEVAGEPWLFQVRAASSVRGDWLRVLGPNRGKPLEALVATPERFNICIGDPPLDRLLVGAMVLDNLAVPSGRTGPPATIECAARRRPGSSMVRYFKVYVPGGERYDVTEPSPVELNYDVSYFQTWTEMAQRLAEGWTPRQETEEHLANIRNPPRAAPPFDPS